MCRLSCSCLTEVDVLRKCLDQTVVRKYNLIIESTGNNPVLLSLPGFAC